MLSQKSSFPINYLNFNGELVEINTLPIDNRAFLYGDGLFDTLLVKDLKLIYSEDHYFRLVSGIRQLRMEIPTIFTQDFWENEILKTLIKNELKNARVRTTVFRNSSGLYTPEQNKISFVVQIKPLKIVDKPNYSVGVYKDNYLTTNSLDNIKSTNRLPNVLAAIFAKENGFDTCFLLNYKKQIASAVNGNVFVIQGKIIKTPPLNEGCVAGIIRKKLLIEDFSSLGFTFQEEVLNIFDLVNADEIFITNSITGIQTVSEFKNKTYKTEIGQFLQKELEKRY